MQNSLWCVRDDQRRATHRQEGRFFLSWPKVTPNIGKIKKRRGVVKTDAFLKIFSPEKCFTMCWQFLQHVDYFPVTYSTNI